MNDESTVRDEARRLAALGPLPPEDDEADDGDAKIDAFEQALLAIEPPVSDAEAVLLLGTFGSDDCFGLGWTLLHLIETAPTGLPLSEPAPDANRWMRRLWQRRQNALPDP